MPWFFGTPAGLTSFQGLTDGAEPERQVGDPALNQAPALWKSLS